VDPSDFLTANFLTANEEPDVEPSVSSSPCPVPPPDDGMRPGSPSPSQGPLPRRGRRSTPPVNVTQLMYLGVVGLVVVVVEGGGGGGGLGSNIRLSKARD
jgi:hypothetical protein